jgi:hypothetical protein
MFDPLHSISYLGHSPPRHRYNLDMQRSGIADLPLHGGSVPKWLADRMTLLGTAIVENVSHHYGTSALMSRLADPFWFQALGSVMGMDAVPRIQMLQTGSADSRFPTDAKTLDPEEAIENSYQAFHAEIESDLLNRSKAGSPVFSNN